MRVLIATILLIAIAQTAGAQQVIQTNLSFRQEVGYMIARFGSALYRDCGFPARPDTLNRRGKGFIAVDTCAMELGLWTGNVWKVIGTGVGGGGNKVDSVTLLGDSLLYWVNGSNFFVGDLGRVLSNGDTSILSYTLDSTGQPQGRVIYSGPGQKLNSQQFFIYSPTQRKLVLNNTNVSIGGNTYRLYVNGRSHTSGLHLDNMTNYIGAPQDDTKPPLAWDTNGDVVVYTAWPKVSSFAKNATRDSTILIFSNGQRFAVRDSVGGAGGITALTGDVTASGPGSAAATLATVNSNVGSFTNANITVNAKGLITAASSGSGGGMTNPMTTLGDIIRGGTGGAPQRLGVGSAGALLRIDPSTLIPEWTPFVLTDTIAIKRYGNVQAANVKSWDGGPTSALAQTIGSSGGTSAVRDSVNYTLGFEAGLDFTSAYKNLAIGKWSMKEGTTAFNNIGIGANTVGGVSAAAFEGARNIGIGVGVGTVAALRVLTTGSDNIGIGTGAQFQGAAGNALTSGSRNTLVGNQSGYTMTTANDNTFVGYQTGITATSGFMSLFGSGAGGALSTGTVDAFGYLAGAAITTGINNLAMAAQSMGSPSGAGSNHTGQYNVAIGTAALAYTASGLGSFSNNRNIAIGGNALRITSTAINDNLYIGFGVTGSTITGNRNISIGNIANPMSLSGSDQLAIGVSTDANNSPGGNPNRWLISDVSGSNRRWLFNATTTDVSAIANASAALEINGTGGGFLPPRMTATQAEAISSPAEGLLIYSTNGTGTTITSKGWWGYDGTTWVKLN